MFDEIEISSSDKDPRGRSIDEKLSNYLREISRDYLSTVLDTAVERVGVSVNIAAENMGNRTLISAHAKPLAASAPLPAESK